MDSPCKGCTKRKVGCHNVETCKPWSVYVEFNKKRLDEKNRIYEELQDVRQHLWRHGYTKYDKPKG